MGKNILTKRCGKCGKVKPVIDFHKNKYSKDGLFFCCKECKKMYRVKNKTKLPNEIAVKKCNQCGKLKSINEFYIKPYESKDGYYSICKECQKSKVNLYKKSEKGSKYLKEYRQTTEYKKRRRAYETNRRRNPNVKEYHKNYNKRDEVKEYSNKWHIEKYRKDITYKLNNLMSKRINQSLRSNKQNRHWEDLVGYTIEDLKKHLESKFKDNMNWDNIGKWHIDHIKPVSSFNFKSFTDYDFKECWELKNLQPLWAKDNLSKGSKLILMEENKDLLSDQEKNKIKLKKIDNSILKEKNINKDYHIELIYCYKIKEIDIVLKKNINSNINFVELGLIFNKLKDMLVPIKFSNFHKNYTNFFYRLIRQKNNAKVNISYTLLKKAYEFWRP